jgi:hypothetical protein
MGIAVAMALALTAVMGVAQASASEFVRPGAGAGQPTTLSGTRVGLKNHNLGLGADSFSCSGVAFSGQMTGPSAEQASVTPELGCSWLGYATSWSIGTCKYRLHVSGSVDIAGCTQPMSWTGFGCKIEIGNQNGIGTVSYKNTETEKYGTIAASALLTGITYTRQGSCNGGPGTYTNGTYTGEWTIKGSDSTGTKVNIAVNATPPPPPSKFVAQEAAASISAEAINAKFISTREGALQCKSKWATELPTGEADSITVTPILSGCSFRGETSGFSTSYGGCSFKHYASGAFEIVGATCASNPFTIVDNTHVGEECTITIGPQGPLAIFTVTNEGLEAARKVKMNANQLVANLTYTATGPHCPVPGTFSDGQYKPTGISVTAKNSKGETRGIWVE